MQIFMPYENASEVAKCLDSRRLLKQIVECGQVIDAIEKGTRWKNHPAVRSFRFSLTWLKHYKWTLSYAWIARGIEKRGYVYSYKGFDPSDEIRLIDPSEHAPPFIGISSYHESHRSNLVRKATTSTSKLDRDYVSMWPDTPSDLPYLWPILHDSGELLAFKVGTSNQFVSLSGKTSTSWKD